MSFKQISGKDNTRKNIDNKNNDVMLRKKTVLQQGNQKYNAKLSINNTIQKNAQERRSSVSKYALPWIKNQTQTNQQSLSFIRSLSHSKVDKQPSLNAQQTPNTYNQNQNVLINMNPYPQNRQPEQQQYLYDSSDQQQQNYTFTNNQNTIQRQRVEKYIKKELFDPWDGKIKKKQENIILNYLNGKIKLDKTGKKKKKRNRALLEEGNQRLLQNQSKQKDQYVVVPVSNANGLRKSFQRKYKNQKKNKSRNKLINQNKLPHSPQKQHNRHMSMLIQTKTTVQKQNKVIQDLKSKILKLQQDHNSNEKTQQNRYSNLIQPNYNQQTQIQGTQLKFLKNNRFSNHNKTQVKNKKIKNAVRNQLENWKHMQRIKLLRNQGKDRLYQEVEVVKPKIFRKSYQQQKKCGISTQSNKYTVLQPNKNISSKHQRNKTQTQCETNHRFSTSRVSKDTPQKVQVQKDTRRIVYYQKELQQKPGRINLNFSNMKEKMMNFQKQKERLQKQRQEKQKYQNQNQYPKPNNLRHNNGTQVFRNPINPMNNSRTMISNPKTFTRTNFQIIKKSQIIKLPQKQFLKLKTFYSQMDKLRYNQQSFPTITIQNFKQHLKKLPSQLHLRQFIQQYIPQYRKIHVLKLMHQENFKILLQENVQLYFGEVSANKKHGLGVTIKENYLFEGEYRGGQKFHGIQINKQGKYVGQFKNNKKQGKGQYWWNNGEYYNGQWADGKKQGYGMWSAINGDHYIGQWTQGRVQGQGVHTSLNGQHYEGSFKNFLKQGWGKQLLPNGDIYEGQFFAGKPHGKGTYKWKQGHTYQGQFQKGLRENLGILEDFVQNIYKGHFKSQQATGFCQINFKNGDHYEGIIQNGHFTGRGTLRIYQSKQIWNGYWIKDQFVDSVD